MVVDIFPWSIGWHRDIELQLFQTTFSFFHAQWPAASSRHSALLLHPDKSVSSSAVPLWATTSVAPVTFRTIIPTIIFCNQGVWIKVFSMQEEHCWFHTCTLGLWGFASRVLKCFMPREASINYIKNQKTLKQMKTDVWRNKKKRIHLIKTCRPGQVWTGSHSTKLEQCNYQISHMLDPKLSFL